MEEASNSPAPAPRTAGYSGAHYMLEAEWPHRAVPTIARAPRQCGEPGPAQSAHANTGNLAQTAD